MALGENEAIRPDLCYFRTVLFWDKLDSGVGLPWMRNFVAQGGSGDGLC